MMDLCVRVCILIYTWGSWEMIDEVIRWLPTQESKVVEPWKHRIITCERALLYTVSFDLNVTHPFKALQDIMKTVRGKKMRWIDGWSDSNRVSEDKEMRWIKRP